MCNVFFQTKIWGILKTPYSSFVLQPKEHITPQKCLFSLFLPRISYTAITTKTQTYAGVTLPDVVKVERHKLDGQRISITSLVSMAIQVTYRRTSRLSMRIVKNADLVITGEGSADRQTLMGKLPMGILKHSRNVPVCLQSYPLRRLCVLTSPSRISAILLRNFFNSFLHASTG